MVKNRKKRGLSDCRRLANRLAASGLADRAGILKALKCYVLLQFLVAIASTRLQLRLFHLNIHRLPAGNETKALFSAAVRGRAKEVVGGAAAVTPVTPRAATKHPLT